MAPCLHHSWEKDNPAYIILHVTRKGNIWNQKGKLLRSCQIRNYVKTAEKGGNNKCSAITEIEPPGWKVTEYRAEDTGY